MRSTWNEPGTRTSRSMTRQDGASNTARTANTSSRYLKGLSHARIHFLSYKIILAAKKFKNWPRPLFRPRTNQKHTCNQKPNPSRETVPLKNSLTRYNGNEWRPDPLGLLTFSYSAQSRSTQRIWTHVGQELGYLITELASRLIVWFLAGFSIVQRQVQYSQNSIHYNKVFKVRVS